MEDPISNSLGFIIAGYATAVVILFGYASWLAWHRRKLSEQASTLAQSSPVNKGK